MTLSDEQSSDVYASPSYDQKVVNEDPSTPLLESSGHGHGMIMDSRLATATEGQTAMNLIKGYIASGILALPSAFQQGGIVNSTIIMIGILAMSMHSMLVLIECKNALRGQVTTFADIGQKTYGAWMFNLINALLIFTQFGFSTVYMVYVSQNLAYYWGNDHIHQVYVLLILFPIFVGLSWIRTMRWLGPASQFANICLALGLLIMVIISFTQISEQAIPNVSLNVELAVWKSLPIMFGTAVYAIEGIGIILPCETAMKEPQKFPRVMILCVTAAGTLYIFFALVGYLAFGNDTCAQLTNNLSQFANATCGGLAECSSKDSWNAVTSVSRISLCIAILISFPIQLFVVTDICEEIMFKPGRLSHKRKTLIQNVFRTGLCVLAAIVALTVPNFGLLVSIIGNVGGASLQFVFPTMFFYKLFPKGFFWKKCLLTFYLLVGLIGGITGTVVTIKELIDPVSVPPNCVG